MIAGLLIAALAVVGPQDDLKRDMRALEIYLQDQEDHKNYCPKTRWNQPDIEVYKRTLKSQLPKGCK